MGVATILWLVSTAGSAVSLVVRRPWTSVLARRRLHPNVWEHPVFMETNMVLTGVWTVFFGAAAAVSAVTPGWSSAIMGALFGCLGEMSHVAGRRYATWRMTRAGG